MASWDLERLSSRIRAAAFEAEAWPGLLADLSCAAGGAGALLFSVNGTLPRPLASPDEAETLDDYLRFGWHERDVRFRGISEMERSGIITDFDCIHEEDMDRSEYYQDFLARRGRRWFAGIGFRTGKELWCLSIQRTVAQGPFMSDELEKLRSLWSPLNEAAAFSRDLGQARVAGAIDALEATTQGGPRV